MRLDNGATIGSVERGDGRVGVAVHPWDITVAHDRPPDGFNALEGTIGATTLQGGRSRVRVGEVLAERAPDDTALERGAMAYAVFAPEAVRLIPLDPHAHHLEAPQ